MKKKMKKKHTSAPTHLESLLLLLLLLPFWLFGCFLEWASRG
jgi:hypothetical protein